VNLELRQALSRGTCWRDATAGHAARRFVGRAAAGEGRWLECGRHAVTERRRLPSRHRPFRRVFAVSVQGAAAPGCTIDEPLPLTFDIFDRWRRSSAAAVYHVAHPAAAATTPSVNSYEAEARRLARSRTMAPPGFFDYPEEERSLDIP